MTNEEQNTDLARATKLLPVGSYSIDRCRHDTVTETSLWFFKAGRTQIGSATRVPVAPGSSERWRVNRMAHGLPTTEIHVSDLAAAVAHILAV